MRENNKNNSNSSRSKAMESLSLEINRYPRDLLDRFTPQQFANREESRAASDGDDEVEGEVELNLGLSLGGRFGVDKHASKLTRSSSIAGSLPVVRELDDAFGARPVSNYPASLMRTSSLPTETEEEWRKRKEMQSLRRMEAKRRRSEKQKNLRGELNLEEERKDLNLNNRGNWVVPPWPINASRVGSQGSVESQGGSSSSLSEMESKPIQGSSIGSESRSPGSFQSLQEQSNPDAIGSSGTKTKEIARTTSRSDMENQPNPSGNRGREIGTNAMEDMPCVFTKGDGPNGRRIDGILYKYGKGEEVRIMCVCHGIFLSPAEFVKHAGGGDVDHPLRHIVINPSGTSFS